MSENIYANYLNYVRDVLGAQNFVSASYEGSLRDHFFHPDPNLEIEKQWDILFVNSVFTSLESLFEKEQEELFQKMLKAMNLDGISALAVDSSIMNEREILRRWKPYGSPKVLVIFKQNPHISDGLRLIDDSAVLETYSPYHLIQNPEFKKITWLHLQQVMKHFTK